jgi:hypothetical protein
MERPPACPIMHNTDANIMILGIVIPDPADATLNLVSKG